MNKRIERKIEKLLRKLSNRYDFDEYVLIIRYAHSIVGELIREAPLGFETFEIRCNSDSDIMFAKDVAKVVELYLEDFKEKGFCNY